MSYVVNKNSSPEIIAVFFFLEWLIFLQFKTLNNMYARIEHILTENETIALYFPVIDLYLQILITCHLLGLVYYFLAVFEIEVLNSTDTWLHILDI